MLQNRKRVVITGLGVISSIGLTKEIFWSNLIKGKSGIQRIKRFDTSNMKTQIAGEIANFNPMDFIDKKQIRRMDRFTQFAVAASLSAIEDSKLMLNGVHLDSVGVFLGTAVGGAETINHQFKNHIAQEIVHPLTVPISSHNAAASQISIIGGFKGPNITCSTACASGLHSIVLAYDQIATGRIEIALAGGSEAPITDHIVNGFSSLDVLSTRNNEPELSSRPFDKYRDGFVIGEGSGIVILEELDRALKRKAHIYAEIIGYGMTNEAYNIVMPEDKGHEAARTMSKAIIDASIQVHEVDYINAHGTSTIINDAVETKAIKKIFGNHAYNIGISSIKSMIGHTLGAAGAIELIATALTIDQNIMPPTINFAEGDSECDLDYIPNYCRHKLINIAMSNSFGFGGNNVSIVLKKNNRGK